MHTVRLHSSKLEGALCTLLQTFALWDFKFDWTEFDRKCRLFETGLTSPTTYRSFVCLFFCLFIRVLVCSYICLFVHSFFHSFTFSFFVLDTISADLQPNQVTLTWTVAQMKKLKLAPSIFVWWVVLLLFCISLQVQYAPLAINSAAVLLVDGQLSTWLYKYLTTPSPCHQTVFSGIQVTCNILSQTVYFCFIYFILLASDYGRLLMATGWHWNVMLLH